MKLEAKRKEAKKPEIEEARPVIPQQEEPEARVAPPPKADPNHVLHLRCRESTQIASFGQSLDEARSADTHNVKMALKPELCAVEVLINIKDQRRRFLVPLNLVSHIELESVGPATK